MKLVKHTVEQIRPGDIVTTTNWSATSDGRQFEVLEVFQDQWLLCRNSRGQHRQFAVECVRRIA